MANRAPSCERVGARRDVLALIGLAAGGLATRRRELSPGACKLHQWVLRTFADEGRPPNASRLAGKAKQLGVDPDLALRELTRLDLVVRNNTGEIRGAYPFSACPTHHRVRIDGGPTLYAMCAIDALGIPPMLRRDAAIVSEDVTTGRAVRVSFQSGQARWDPPEAVVLVGVQDHGGTLAHSCCTLINFFASVECAQTFQQAHPGIESQVMSQAEALALAIEVFDPVLVSGSDCDR